MCDEIDAEVAHKLGRTMALLHAQAHSTTAELRGEAEAYLQVTVDRLQRWLGSGKFTRALPGG